MKLPVKLLEGYKRTRRQGVFPVACAESSWDKLSTQTYNTPDGHHRVENSMNDMFRMLVFFGLITPAFASQTLDALVSAAANFSAAIQQQLATIQSNPSPARLAEKTIEYAQAKTAFCQALRAAMPELINIATGRQARPPELDKFATAFAISDEKQEKVADQKTMMFLKRFSRNPRFLRRSIK